MPTFSDGEPDPAQWKEPPLNPALTDPDARPCRGRYVIRGEGKTLLWGLEVWDHGKRLGILLLRAHGERGTGKLVGDTCASVELLHE